MKKERADETISKGPDKIDFHAFSLRDRMLISREVQKALIFFFWSIGRFVDFTKTKGTVYFSL